MQFEVKSRFTGNVQFTAEIDCDETMAASFKMGLAVKWAIKTDANLLDANLRGADLRDADLRGADLQGADLRDADLRGADLQGADLRDADLRGADLRGADLQGADLRDADLRGADLQGADLRDADLRGADLRDANLRGADLIHCGVRSDGYDFYAHIRNDKIWVKAGCRYFEIKDAEAHWKRTRAGTQLGDESLQLLRNAKALVKIRGMLEPQPKETK